MKFDCKSQHHKCKATCCGLIDFEKDLWEKNQHKVVTQPIEILEFLGGKRVLPKTESGYCAFLREDLQCNIYDDRPEICVNYGDESTFYMSCPYLKKDGTERSRQHRRCLERKIDKFNESPHRQLIQFNQQNDHSK